MGHYFESPEKMNLAGLAGFGKKTVQAVGTCLGAA